MNLYVNIKKRDWKLYYVPWYVTWWEQFRMTESTGAGEYDELDDEVKMMLRDQTRVTEASRNCIIRHLFLSGSGRRWQHQQPWAKKCERSPESVMTPASSSSSFLRLWTTCWMAPCARRTLEQEEAKEDVLKTFKEGFGQMAAEMKSLSTAVMQQSDNFSKLLNFLLTQQFAKPIDRP